MRAAVTRPETIIVVTNYPSDDYRTASRECGADHFFDKASEFHKVREVLLNALGAWTLGPIRALEPNIALLVMDLPRTMGHPLRTHRTPCRRLRT